jgi:hypothetical protein
MGNATFTISSSALRVEYDSMRTTYSVGEPITLALEATNRLGSDLDSVYSQIQLSGDLAALVQDSASSGPTYIVSDGTAMFQHHFSARQPGSVVFRSRAIATTIDDSSAVITSDDVIIQSVPSALELSLHNFMPTAVARGQKNVFPLSLQLSHGDVSGAAVVEVRSITISVMNASGTPQSASSVFSRLLLADDESPVAVLTTFADSTEVQICINPALTLEPADTAEMVLLMDISDTALASSLTLGIETIDAVEAVDANTGYEVALNPAGPMPLRTASCRIDNPSQTLAVSNSSPPLAGVNVGQHQVAILGLRLRHPGGSGVSQIQVVELSLAAVSGLDTLAASSVADRISVYRSTELLGEATGLILENDLISIDLGAGLTINPNSRDSLIVRLSLAHEASVDSFQVVVSDSSGIKIRDVVSGSEVTAVTDQEILATGSVFPLASPTVKVYQPSEELTYCIANPLPSTVVAGTRRVSLVSLTLEHNLTPLHSPIRLSEVSVFVLDSSGIPLDPGQLFDRTGYRIGTGSEQYHSTLSLRNGATVFPLSDTGVVLAAPSQLSIELIADIESDCPYDNFRLILDDASTIGLADAIDITRIPILFAALSCDTFIPYQSSVTSVFRPAGSPRLAPEADSTRLAYPGQTDLSIGSLEFGYTGDINQGDIEFTSLQVVVCQRNGSSELPVPVASVFSRLCVNHDGSQIAEDTLFSGDASILSIDPSVILSHGFVGDISIVGDVQPDALPGNYRIKILDSTALVLRDKNLGTPVYPVLETGDFPAVLAAISIAVRDLSTSFSNYPNPFVAQEEPTTIAYVLPEDANVDVEVFSITGEPVARITKNERRSAGPHQDQTWDGLNDAGLEVVPGTYFCRITARYESGRIETARRKVSVIR